MCKDVLLSPDLKQSLSSLFPCGDDHAAGECVYVWGWGGWGGETSGRSGGAGGRAGRREKRFSCICMLLGKRFVLYLPVRVLCVCVWG